MKDKLYRNSGKLKKLLNIGIIIEIIAFVGLCFNINRFSYFFWIGAGFTILGSVFYIDYFSNEGKTWFKGLDAENAEEAFEILEKCGIDNISELKKGTETNNVASYTTTYTNSDYDSYSLMIFIAEERLYAINSGSLTIYNRDQKVQININDYILSTSEKTNLQTIAKEYVKQNLKAPSTAEFPGSFLSPFEGWEMQQSGTTYKVKSYVDSQNSFGAMIRTQFYLELKFDSNGNLKVTKFQTS